MLRQNRKNFTEEQPNPFADGRRVVYTLLEPPQEDRMDSRGCSDP
jgi:hypothetical protein